MSGGLRITLRSGEKIFVNGAVLRVDRKVAIELLNDVTFLLEQHVIKAEDTHTPLRQLYFMVQTMLIDPPLYLQARDLAKASLETLMATLSDKDLLAGLREASICLEAERPLEVLKKLRLLLPIEQRILAGSGHDHEPAKEVA